MHYGAYDFAINKTQKTIVQRTTNDGKGCEIGQNQGFSEVDLKKINTLYNCKGLITIKPDLSCEDAYV